MKDMTENETRVEKVAKLLAKAERAGTPEEAETFFAKAQELMSKWAIDEASVRAAQGGYTRGDVIERRIKLNTTYAKVDASLMATVAKHNDCRVLIGSYSPGYGIHAYLYGFEADVARVEMIWTSLLIQVARQQKSADDLTWERDKRKVRQSFRYGFCNGIDSKLKAARATAMVDVEPSLLPVLVAKKDLVEKHVDEIAAPSRSRGVTVNSAAAAAGRSAGLNADVNQTRVSNGSQGAIGSGR
jgi:hypothetical protein